MKAKIIVVPVKQTTPSGVSRNPPMATIATQIPMPGSSNHAFDDASASAGWVLVAIIWDHAAGSGPSRM